VTRVRPEPATDVDALRRPHAPVPAVPPEATFDAASAPAGDGRGGADGRLPRALVGAVVALAALTRLPGLIGSRAFDTDEATLAVGGRVLARGGSLYVDVIDRKPPLPFAAYAAVQRITGTTDLRPVRLLVAALIAVAALVAASEAGRRWGRRSAWVTGIVVVLGASALGPADAQAANFELFALLPITVAVVAAARGRAVVAGVALTVAVLCKQPAAVTAVPVAWSLWQAGRWRSLALGGVVGAVVTVALAAPFGVGQVVEWALLGTGGYLGADPADLGFALVRLAAMLALALGFWCGAWLLVTSPSRQPGPRSALGATSTAPATEPADPRRRAGSRRDVDLWLLLALSALAVTAGFRFFPHYLLQLVPAVALLAGRGASRRPRRIPLAAALGAAALVVAVALAGYQAAQPAPRVQGDLSAYVARTTAPGDRILVWGNLPEVYWRSGRDPAGGFTHTEFVTGYSGGRRHHLSTESDVPDRELYRRFVARIGRERPVLVLDTAAAGERGGDHFPLAEFPAVTSLLRTGYQRVATVGGVPVYRLRGSEPPP